MVGMWPSRPRLGALRPGCTVEGDCATTYCHFPPIRSAFIGVHRRFQSSPGFRSAHRVVIWATARGQVRSDIPSSLTTGRPTTRSATATSQITAVTPLRTRRRQTKPNLGKLGNIGKGFRTRANPEPRDSSRARPIPQRHPLLSEECSRRVFGSYGDSGRSEGGSLYQGTTLSLRGSSSNGTTLQRCAQLSYSAASS